MQRRGKVWDVYGQRGRSQSWKAFIVFLGVCRSETTYVFLEIPQKSEQGGRSNKLLGFWKPLICFKQEERGVRSEWSFRKTLPVVWWMDDRTSGLERGDQLRNNDTGPRRIWDLNMRAEGRPGSRALGEVHEGSAWCVIWEVGEW